MCSSGHALPDANRTHSLGFGSFCKDWDGIRLRMVQLINFLSMPTEQKEKADIIVLDSDDEDGNRSGYNKLAFEIGKELTTSELARNITERVTYNGSQAFLTMHADGDKNIQIVPHGQCSALVNQLPLQSSWQPSIQFERVVLQKRPEEQRMQDVVV